MTVFSIEQKVLEQQIELHIGAIQSRVHIRFIHKNDAKTNFERKRNEQNSFRD